MCCASASHARQVTSLRWWFCVTRCQGDFDNARFHYTVARRLASSHDAPLINANLAKLDATMTTTTTSSRTISIAQQRQQPQQQQRQRRRRRAGTTSLVTSTNEQCASNRHCHSLHRHHRYPSTTSYNVSSYLCVSCHYYSNDSRLNRRWWYGRQFATKRHFYCGICARLRSMQTDAGFVSLSWKRNLFFETFYNLISHVSDSIINWFDAVIFGHVYWRLQYVVCIC